MRIKYFSVGFLKADSHNNRGILIIFFLALMLRLFYGLYTNALFHPMPWEYEDIAVNLYAGRGFVTDFAGGHYYAYATPLYPLFCFIIYKIFGHNPSLVILSQIIISSALCFVIYFIGKYTFGRSVALLASLFVAIYPPLVIYPVIHLHAFTLDTFFICLTVLSFILLADKPTYTRAIICGIVYGLCALTRATILPVLFIGIIWLAWFRKESMKNITKCSSAMIISAFIILAPWSIRNYLIFKRPILITTVSAENFWRGNNINATGTSFTGDGRRVFDADSELLSEIEAMNEIERYDLFRSEAAKFITNYPGRFMYLTANKFYYFWWFSPDSGKFYSKNGFLVYRYLYLLIFISALIGIALGLANFRKNRIIYAKVLLLLIALLTVSIGQSFFYVEGRHRLALEPLLLIFSAYAIIYIRQRCLKTKI